jgi:hypothetical protein
MIDEWLFLLAPGANIVPIIAFGRRFKVEFPPKSSWLSQEISEILEVRAGARVFSGTLDIGESYALAHLLRSSRQSNIQISLVMTVVSNFG